MIQVLEDNSRPSRGKQLASGIEQMIPGIQQFAQAHQQEKLRQQENQATKQFGIDLTDIQDPQMRQQILAESLRGNRESQMQKQKQEFEFESDKNNYQTIKDRFGKEFADVWKAAPTGGRTALLQSALDISERGEDVSDLLKNVQKPLNEPTKVPKELPQVNSENGKLPKDFEWPIFNERPKGYTAKEWIDTKKGWRKENAPIFEDIKNRLANTKKDILSTKSLMNLNESRKVGEGFEASLINPETGDVYGLAQLTGLVSPETQQWVKEIARFQNRAKDAFGSRVTNFDLQSYMKQFPGLLNTYEGRRRILRMMDINYKLDDLYQNALNQVYDHYGLDGIPQEKAEEMAQGMIKNEVENLRSDYLELDEQNQYIQPKLQDKKLQEDRSKRLDEIIG